LHSDECLNVHFRQLSGVRDRDRLRVLVLVTVTTIRPYLTLYAMGAEHLCTQRVVYYAPLGEYRKRVCVGKMRLCVADTPVSIVL